MSLFLVAILPPDKIDEQVRLWKNFMLEKFGCQVALKSPAHITLIPPFHFPDSRELELTHFLSKFSFEHHAFDIHLHDFSAFVPKVIFVHVLQNAALLQLKSELETAMIAAGYPIAKEERPFHPHVTIANRDLQKKDFPAAYSFFQTLTYHESFSAGSVTLLKHNGRIWERIHDAILPEN